MLWITAVEFDDSALTDHRHLRRVRWHKPDTNEDGEASVEEVIELIRAHTLVYVSDELFERSAVVRVVDDSPPYIRAWAHGH
jgi:uncharacterized protein YgfB (UPF0149 family)